MGDHRAVGGMIELRVAPLEGPERTSRLAVPACTMKVTPLPSTSWAVSAQSGTPFFLSKHGQ